MSDKTYEINQIKCPYCGLIFQDDNFLERADDEVYELECDCGKYIDVVWSYGLPAFTAYKKDQE